MYVCMYHNIRMYVQYSTISRHIIPTHLPFPNQLDITVMMAGNPLACEYIMYVWTYVLCIMLHIFTDLK